jgi:hypothetical protein
MAIAVILEWAAGDDGVNDDTYWKMTDKLGLRDRLPEGCSHHVAAFDPQQGGIVTEIWDSQEAFGRFTQEQQGPAAKELGLAAPTRVSVLPVIRALGA